MDLKEVIREHKVLLIITIVIGLACLYQSGGFSIFEQIQLNQGTAGCEYILSSVDKVDYKDYIPEIGKEGWILEITATEPGGDCAYLTVKKEYIIDTEDNKGVESDLKLFVRQKASRCEYGISSPGVYGITSYDYRFSKSSIVVPIWKSYDTATEEWAENNCVDGSAYALASNAGIGYNNVWFVCIIEDILAYPGYISTPYYAFATEIGLETDTYSDSTIIGTAQLGEGESVSLSGDIGDIGFVKWKGSMSSGQYCPFSFMSNTKPYYTNNNWRIGDNDLLDDYKDYNRNLYPWECYKGCLVGDCFPDAKQCILDMYFDVRGVTKAIEIANYRDYADNLGYLNSYIENKGDSQKSYLKIDTEKLVNYPSFVIYIDPGKIETISLKQPHGVPKIDCLGKVEGNAGSYNSLQISVKNIADEDYGYFASEMICRDVVKPNLPYPSVKSIEPRGVDTRYMIFDYYLPATATDISEICTISVYDINKPSERDSCTVKVTTHTIEWCNEGEERCSGANRQLCEGNKWVNIEDGYCEWGCETELINNKRVSYCVQPPTTKCGNGICEPEYGEDIVTCPRDCGDGCDYGCESFDLECKFMELMCKMKKFITGALMFIGLGLGGIIVIWLIFKIMTVRRPPPRHFRQPYEFMQHPYERGKELLDRRRYVRRY